ncbi:MAG: hypothetical protein ACJAXZ_004106 [Akkermansiaceae bacterium]|jgi:hypothetical protein
MKFPVILSIICLGIGLAIGWIAKPASSDSETEVVKAAPPKVSDRKEPSLATSPAEESDRKVSSAVRVIGGEETNGITDEQKAQRKKGQDFFGNMMKKSRTDKLDARISKLVAQLNLSPTQEAALRKAAEDSLGGLDSLMEGGFDPSKLGSLTGDSDLDEALAEILTDEQKEEHEALKKREVANKVEATALKDLAKLSNLDMTQEQKDAAYDILYKQAEEKTTNQSPQSGMLSMITSGLGIELDIDAEDLGITGAVIGGDEGEDPSGEQARDPRKMMERMRENQQKKVDEKVEALRPVLDDNQLEQYRKSLEIKQGGILGSFLGGFGKGAEEEVD